MVADKEKRASRQEQAITDYLQALLYEEVQQDSVRVQLDEPQPTIIGLEKLVAEIPDHIDLPVVKAKGIPEAIPEEVEQPVIEEPEIEIQVQARAVEPVQETSLVVDDEPIPEWAMEAFQCLLFKVSGLTLAVPLVKLNSVIPWSDKIVETPNQTEWYLGLVNNLGKNIKVIDTALMVMPENRRHTIVTDADDRFSHILLVDQNRWGLACDSIGDVIWMTNDKVKWRKTKKQRPWLAGTSLDHLCALIDTAVFADMLDEKVSS